MRLKIYGLILVVLSALVVLPGCGSGGDPVSPNPSDPFTDDPDLDPSGIPHWTPDYQNDREQVQEDEWLKTVDDIGIHLMVHRPADSSSENQYPGLILVPGGLQAGHAWHARWRQSNAWEFVDAGMIVLLYDSRGRGYSSGAEDYNGPLGQRDLRQVIDWFNARADVVPGGVGIATSSWGITVASGTLARYPDVEAKFLLDLEGAQDRYVMTQWDDEQWLGIMHGHGTWDNEFWEDREAIKYIGDVRCPYIRIQSNFDHALDYFYVDHAIALVNAAVEGASPYVQMNEMEQNVIYDSAKAQEYAWCPIDNIDAVFFNAVLEAMSGTTKLE